MDVFFVLAGVRWGIDYVSRPFLLRRTRGCFGHRRHDTCKSFVFSEKCIFRISHFIVIQPFWHGHWFVGIIILDDALGGCGERPRHVVVGVVVVDGGGDLKEVTKGRGGGRLRCDVGDGTNV